MSTKVYPYRTIQTVIVILERIDDTAFRARLSNGKELIAFVERKNRELGNTLRTGDRVAVTISPADFERARIDAVVGEGE